MSDTFDAWFLPSTSAVGDRVLEAGRLTCRYPDPTAPLLDDAVRHLRAAGARLAERDIGGIIRSIDAVARRLTDAADPLAREAATLVARAVGYSAPMARLVLERMAADWRAEPLERMLDAELGGAAVLDGFVERDGRVARAYGPRLAFHVFAGNVPGVAVTSMVRTLLLRAPSFGKLPAGEPVLPVLFARALAETDPALADAIALTYWPGGSAAPEQQLTDAADTVIVYGGDTAVDSIRRRTRPDQQLLVHGPRFSIGLVGAAALADAGAVRDTARDVALAVATFDQQGCVSPHAVYVEDPGGGAGAALAGAVADALRELEARLPRGRIGTGEAAAIHQERGAAEMRSHAGAGVTVWAGEGTTWTVVHEAAPDFRPSCLNRFLRVHSVPRLEDCPDILRPAGAHIQSVALAGADDRRAELADRLARIGATRITTFQRLPWPPAHWHHDGRGPLREIVRWVDLEG